VQFGLRASWLLDIRYRTWATPQPSICMIYKLHWTILCWGKGCLVHVRGLAVSLASYHLIHWCSLLWQPNISLDNENSPWIRMTLLLFMVAQVCNPRYSRHGDQEDLSLRSKSLWDHISTNSWVWWTAPVIPATQGSTNRIVVHVGVCIKQDSISKIASKRARGIVLVVEHRPCKCKTQNSTPNTTKNNEK
jgi:hypothetical protein